MKTIKEKFVRFLIWCLTPLIKFLGDIHIPTSVKKITGEHYYVIRDFIKPFDVILTSTKGHGSNLVNFSEINHGYLYFGDVPVVIDNKKYIVKGGGEYESVGGHIEDLVSRLLTTDRFVVLRFKHFKSTIEYHQMLHWAEHYLKGDYNFEFDLNEKLDGKNKATDEGFTFYCFAYVMKIFQKTFPKILFKYQEVLGRKFYTSDSFLKDSENFEIIYDSDKHNYSMEKLYRERGE